MEIASRYDFKTDSEYIKYLQLLVLLHIPDAKLRDWQEVRQGTLFEQPLREEDFAEVNELYPYQPEPWSW